MKKLVTALLTMVLLISAMTVTALAEEQTYNGFVYEDSGEAIVIYDYVGTETEITVPATIDGKPVTALWTSSANDTVTTITLEEGIIELGHSALMDYTALKTVYLPSTMEMLGQSAITHATNVENVFVAEGCENFVDFDGVLYERMWRYQVSSDGEILFDEPIVVDGYGLRVYPAGRTDASYTVLDTVRDYPVVSLEERAFSGAKHLESISVPASVNRIWYAAFEKCEGLEKLIFYNMKHNEVFEDGVGDEPEAIFGYEYDEETDEYKMAPNWVENLTVYCYKGSDMDNYATSLSYEDIQVEVSYLDNATVSDSGNVVVAGKEENAIEAGTVLVVADVVAEKLGTAAKEKLGDMKYTVMDITLMKNGVAVQPKGKVTVSIDLPEGFNGSKCKVYHIANDGTFTDMKATFANGKLSFDTDHFSQYAIVEGTVDSSASGANGTQTSSPKTGDVSDMMMWTMIMLACGATIVMLRREKKKI